MKRVCQAMEASRSNVYEKLTKDQTARKKKRDYSRDREILSVIRQLTDERPTYGYRRITALLRKRLNQAINVKRVYRLMKENSLLLQKYCNKPTRVHDGKVITLKSNLRWCSDHFSIQCWNGDQVHVAFVLDCHDREAISWIASNKGVDGQMIRDLITEFMEIRFPFHHHLPNKLQWLSDNGPAYVARQTINFGRSLGFEMCTTLLTVQKAMAWQRPL